VGASVVGKVSSQEKDVAEAAGRTLRSLLRDSEAEREGQCRSRWGRSASGVGQVSVDGSESWKGRKAETVGSEWSEDVDLIREGKETNKGWFTHHALIFPPFNIRDPSWRGEERDCDSGIYQGREAGSTGK
jgi:hypothetical protein